jgi:hypothetical protein
MKVMSKSSVLAAARQTPTVVLVAAFVATATGWLGARQSLPTGREVVDKHVAAIGGEAAYKTVKSIRARGRLEIKAQGIAGDLEILSARPARSLYRVTVPGIGRIENGYDGSVGWTISPITGPELLSGKELSEAADDAWFDATLYDGAHIRELTTQAIQDFDGHQAYKVKVVRVSGNEETEYFDVASGFQIVSEAVRTTPNGPIATTNVLRDYRKFGPLFQATTFIQRAMGFEQVVTISSCEYDTVPDSAFDPPAEIKALGKPAPAASAASPTR